MGASSSDDLQELAQMVETFWTTESVPVLEQMLEQLRALNPPEGDADLLEDLYDDLEAAAEDAGTTLEEAADGDAAALEAVFGSQGALDSLFDDVNQRATEYGLDSLW